MNLSRRSWVTVLTTSDLATIIFLAIVSVLCLSFAPVIPQWYILAGSDVLLIYLILFFAVKAKRSSSRIVRYIRDWYPVPMILFIFKQTYLMVHPIHPQDYDWLLIAIDRKIFGADPALWLQSIAHPFLTEILQISYTCYYLILLSVFFELGLEKRHTEYFFGAFLVVYGFYLSYVGYLLIPAVGPRFTLHDFSSLNETLPGLWLTSALRDFVNAGESIPKGALHAVDYAQRDAFPSGHTEMTLIVLYVAFKQHLRSRWVLLVVGSLLIFSTVYLWYHYVIDVLAGVIFFLFTVWSGKKLDAWWRAYKKELKARV